MLYFFEKNSLIYLKFILNKKESLEKTPLTIFEDCNKFLDDFKINSSKYHDKSPLITKLFCLGYIKTFCYNFIQMFEEPKPKFNPETIIQKINECDKIKMVKIYIYKIIYNLNNKQIDVFLNQTTKEKYKLDKYENYHDFIKDEVQINEGNQQNPIYDNGNYKDIYKKLFECQKESFENEITKSDICSDEKLNFDDFFMVANNLILVKLKKKDFENDDIYKNFYNNVLYLKMKKKIMKVINY